MDKTKEKLKKSNKTHKIELVENEVTAIQAIDHYIYTAKIMMHHHKLKKEECHEDEIRELNKLKKLSEIYLKDNDRLLAFFIQTIIENTNENKPKLNFGKGDFAKTILRYIDANIKSIEQGKGRIDAKRSEIIKSSKKEIKEILKAEGFKDFASLTNMIIDYNFNTP